jgi:hypothetical protein
MAATVRELAEASELPRCRMEDLIWREVRDLMNASRICPPLPFND